MIGPLILLFILVPAIELFFLIEIGAVIGGLTTILLIIATGVVGASLAKVQGLSILSQIRSELNEGKVPAIKMIHGLLIFTGGVLLLTPGFLTDALGFAMILPGSRHFFVSRLQHFLTNAVAAGTVRFASVHIRTSRRPPTNEGEGANNVIEAEFKEKP